MKTLVDVRGRPTPLEQLFWIGRARCGCVTSSQRPVAGDTVIATADQARAEICDSAQERAQSIRHGVTFELTDELTPEAVQQLTDGCRHTPRYGIEPSTPDGYVWAARSRTAKASHLVMPQLTVLRGSSLCRVLLNQSWLPERDARGSVVRCARCEAAGAKLVRDA